MTARQLAFVALILCTISLAVGGRSTVVRRGCIVAALVLLLVAFPMDGAA
jgi:hypothetical protein